jgi:hypothetical protein
MLHLKLFVVALHTGRKKERLMNHFFFFFLRAEFEIFYLDVEAAVDSGFEIKCISNLF